MPASLGTVPPQLQVVVEWTTQAAAGLAGVQQGTAAATGRNVERPWPWDLVPSSFLLLLLADIYVFPRPEQ